VSSTNGQPTALHYDLARRIVEHARLSDLAAGSHLREAELARRFRVSRSPVRAALRLLASLHIVEHEPNQGVFLARDGRDLDPDLLDDPDVPDQELYRRIVHDRLSGTLPDTVSAAGMGERYDAGRSVLARLLNRMAVEGLIERLPGHRWRFSPALTSPEVYDASYRFRMIVEPAAFLEPSFLTDRAEFDELKAAHLRLVGGEVARVSYSYLYQLDAAFHEAVGRWSRNEFVLRAIQQHNRLRRLTEYEYYADRDRMLASCREHLAILEAVEAGQSVTAAELMRQHIDTSWRLMPRFPSGESGG